MLLEQLMKAPFFFRIPLLITEMPMLYLTTYTNVSMCSVIIISFVVLYSCIRISIINIDIVLKHFTHMRHSQSLVVQHTVRQKMGYICIIYIVFLGGRGVAEIPIFLWCCFNICKVLSPPLPRPIICLRYMIKF